MDQIEMGPICIPKAILEGFIGEFEFSDSVARDVHIAVKLRVKLEFAFGISVDWWFDQWAQGDIEFHPFIQEANLHDVSFIPAGNKKIRIASDKDLSMGPVSVKPEAIGNGTTKSNRD